MDGFDRTPRGTDDFYDGVSWLFFRWLRRVFSFFFFFSSFVGLGVVFTNSSVDIAVPYPVALAAAVEFVVYSTLEYL